LNLILLLCFIWIIGRSRCFELLVSESVLQRRMGLLILLIRLWLVMEPNKVLLRQCLQFAPLEMR